MIIRVLTIDSNHLIFILNFWIYFEHEGAIGSNRKIDASYLSPHVNFTEFLESSTKEYGIPLLLSEPFFKLLSPQAQKYCRQVDRIKRTNGEEPIGLFTYDCDMNIDWNDSSRHFKKGGVCLHALSNTSPPSSVVSTHLCPSLLSSPLLSSSLLSAYHKVIPSVIPTHDSYKTINLTSTCN